MQETSLTEQQSPKSVKRSVAGDGIFIPNKIYCPDDKTNKQSTNNNTFYGLPNRVKELFRKIRNISTLYRKYLNNKQLHGSLLTNYSY